MKASYLYYSILALSLLCASTLLHAQELALERVGPFSAELDESSGLTWAGGSLYSLSDDKLPYLYRVDTSTAETTQLIVVRGISFSDKEALTSDEDYLYIGDFGNNKGHRRDLKIVRLKLSEIPANGPIEVEAEIIAFHYPEQKVFDGKKKENAFDCEAMVAMGDSLYLFTKQRNDHQTTLYALPKAPGEYPAKRHGSFDVQGRITSASLSPTGKHLLLLGYGKKHQQPFIWHFSGFVGSDFFGSGNASLAKAKRYALWESPLDWQLEAITFVSPNRIFLSCEKTDEVEAGLYVRSFPLEP